MTNLSRLPPLAVLTALALPGLLAAQQLSVPGTTTDSVARRAAIARLAGDAAAAYRDTNRVSCCDSSPNRHATAHFHAQPEHALVRSYEPGEDWWWCYVDEELFNVEGAPPAPSHS